VAQKAFHGLSMAWPRSCPLQAPGFSRGKKVKDLGKKRTSRPEKSTAPDHYRTVYLPDCGHGNNEHGPDGQPDPRL
jgi:hypothetical protein